MRKWGKVFAAPRRAATWCHDVTAGICYDKVNRHASTHKKLQNSHFFTWRPWPLTLTFELIRDIIKVNNPHTKFQVPMSNDLAGRVLNNWQMDTQIGPILYPRPLMREGTTLLRLLHGVLPIRLAFWNLLGPCKDTCNSHCEYQPGIAWLTFYRTDISDAVRLRCRLCTMISRDPQSKSNIYCRDHYCQIRPAGATLL